MKKVYLVSSGYYSDYDIEKVFSTKELAEEWVGVFSKGNEYDIEEYDLDSMEDKPVAISGFLCMNLHTGEVIIAEPRTSSNEHWGKSYISCMTMENGIAMKIYFDFFDIEKMTKIAGEKRANILYNLDFIYKNKIKIGECRYEVYFDRDTCLLKEELLKTFNK